MEDKLKKIFDQVQAEQELKENTKTFLYQKTNGYGKRKMPVYRYAAAAACFVCLFLGGWQLYFTPVVSISIDINPSIELEVNRFDKVIAAEGYNDGGEMLLANMNLKHKSYSEAIAQIVGSDTISKLLGEEEILSVSVVGEDDENTARILSDVEACTDEEENTHCYYVQAEEVKDAHNEGLSCGKYKAFLELQKYDAEITASEVQHMTMREIWDRIEELSGGTVSEVVPEHHGGKDDQTESGHHGQEDGQSGHHGE